jgi:hypothetical protein
MPHRSVRRTAVVIAIVAAVLPAADLAAHASTSVNCASRSLQTAINSARANSTLLIKGTCSGTFTLAKNLTLKANPSATLDGDDLGSVLTITGTPAVHLIGVTITGGLAAHGGGINSAGGSLTLNKVKVVNNLAFDPSMALGGGIYAAAGSVHLVSSSITSNRALSASGPSGATANGGGVYTVGNVTIVDSSVTSNRATATSPGGDAAADGGGLYASGAHVTISHSHLSDNRVTVNGLQTFAQAGGCLCGASTASRLSISHSTISGNVLRSNATAGQADGAAAGIEASGKSGTILDSTLAGNQIVVVEAAATSAVATGGAVLEFETAGFNLIGSTVTGTSITVRNAAGQATVLGGAVYGLGVLNLTSTVVSDTKVAIRAVMGVDVSGTAVAEESYTGYPSGLTLRRCTVANNTTTATSATQLAIIQGGAIFARVPISIVGSTVSGNASHAIGSIGGEAFGGGIDATWDNTGSSPKDHLTNSTIANNLLSAKTSTGTATVQGGGVWVTNATATLTDSTVARNTVTGTGATVNVKGGGVAVDTTGTSTVAATIIALNSAPTNASGPDCSGKLGSAGHNLLHSKAGCTFAPKSSDKVGALPGLGALAANGGPTRTIALKAASPAVNAIAKSACLVKTDQRGVRRPQGKRCDIGAYERKVAKP